jgi:1,4-dihydroxy-2-naphthoyl-CoA hydrolase
MEPSRLQQQRFDSLYGLGLIECSEERAEGVVEVREELTQEDGFLHGGVLAALAEALAARGTAAGVRPEGKLALALAIQTTVLHPSREGTIRATAVPRHRGRTTWVWEVEMTDGTGRRCAVARVTVAVRDAER